MIDALDLRHERAGAFRAGVFIGAMLVLLFFGARAVLGL